MLLPGPLRADYSDELRDQIRDLQARYPSTLEEVYFRDMAVIAHKADAAEIMDLAAEIIRKNLWERMDGHVETELEAINALYETDAPAATERLKELVEYRKYFQPTGPFLQTGQGKSLAAEIGQARERLLAQMNQSCATDTVQAAIQVFRKTGLFATGEPREMMSMREFQKVLNCCLSWKAAIVYEYTQTFESEYEAGTKREAAKLKRVSPGSDWNEAQWTGEWRYDFQGREGEARALSSATLRYRKGEDTADLVIRSAKVDSSGRMNMPVPVAGEHRTLEIDGEWLRPQAVFSAEVAIPLSGCREGDR